MKEIITCQACGHQHEAYKNPIPTVDIIIEVGERIVLIKRKNIPFGWAIPGGFVDYGESVEQAAIREAQEETSLQVQLNHLLGVYSQPDRDPRQHTISTVFVARAQGEPIAADDAVEAKLFDESTLPEGLAFDHKRIINDYFWWKKFTQNCHEHDS